MENHLFIGLGGFGGKTLAEIRKAEYLAKETVAKREGKKPKLNYLYVDSSMDVRDEAGLWRVLGEDVRLDPADVIHLKEGSVSSTFDDIDNLPHMASWLGEKSSIEKYLKGAGVNEGANQRRRFGRFLFASNADRFVEKLRQKVNQNGGKAECTFHVFCTCAGGTGSGSLIDTIALIRSCYPDDSAYPIYVYGYLTDRKEDSDADVGYFYPNQYSVIRDLNGLMIGSYLPQNLSIKKVEKVSDRSKYVDLAFLITPENRKSVIYDPQSQVKLVGQWVHQRVLAEVFGNIPGDVAKALTGQDVLADYPGELGENGEIARSGRFGSIGLKRWGIPEEQTREALMLDYLTQAFRQMLYNRWDQQNGYMNTLNESPKDIGSIYSKIQLNSQAAWNLSDSDDYSNFNEEWEKVADDIQFNEGLEKSVKNLARELAEHSNSNFRNTGVKSYFSARIEGGGVNQQSKDVERKLASWIDEQWIDGKLGIGEIIRLLQNLKEDLEAKRKGFLEYLKNQPVNPSRVEKKWLEHAQKPGPLAKVLGIEAKMFKYCKSEMVQTYIEEVTLRGNEYAVELANLIGKEVTKLIGALTQTQNRIASILEGVNKDRKPLLAFGSDSSGDGKDIVEFDNDTYREIWLTMREDKKMVDTIIEECRTGIIKGEKQLVTLHSTSREAIRSLASRVAESHVKPAHDNACSNNSALAGKEILGRNIWDIFEHSNDAGFDNKIQGFLESGVTVAKRSSDKTPNHYNPNLTAKMPREHIMLLNPSHEGNGNESENQSRFKRQLSEGKIHFVTHDTPSEILCLSIDSAAPARLFSVIHNLHNEYASKVQSEDCAYFCHLDPESEPSSPNTHPLLLR